MKIKFIEYLASQVDSYLIRDKQLIKTTDTDKWYFDSSSQRNELNNIMLIESIIERNLLDVSSKEQRKLYFIRDISMFNVWDGVQWNILTLDLLAQSTWYNNIKSKLKSDDVQNAIDELAELILELGTAEDSKKLGGKTPDSYFRECDLESRIYYQGIDFDDEVEFITENLNNRWMPDGLNIVISLSTRNHDNIMFENIFGGLSSMITVESSNGYNVNHIHTYNVAVMFISLVIVNNTFYAFNSPRVEIVDTSSTLYLHTIRAERSSIQLKGNIEIDSLSIGACSSIVMRSGEINVVHNIVGAGSIIVHPNVSSFTINTAIIGDFYGQILNASDEHTYETYLRANTVFDASMIEYNTKVDTNPLAASSTEGALDELTTRTNTLNLASIKNLVYTAGTRLLSLIRNDDTNISITLPQSSLSNDGLMTSSDVATLLDLSNKVESIVAQGVWRSSFDTYADMIAAHPGLDVSDTDWNQNDWVLVAEDEDRDADRKPRTSYIVTVTGDIKTLYFRQEENTNISIFTNDSLGVMKGDSLTDGKIYAETDGTGSVNGWDALNSTVNNKIDKVYRSVPGNVPILNADGSLSDGGFNATTLAGNPTFMVSSNVSSLILGARIGDYIANASQNYISIGNLMSVPPGGIVRITSVLPFSVIYIVGSTILGPQGTPGIPGGADDSIPTLEIVDMRNNSGEGIAVRWVSGTFKPGDMIVIQRYNAGRKRGTYRWRITADEYRFKHTNNSKGYKLITTNSPPKGWTQYNNINSAYRLDVYPGGRALAWVPNFAQNTPIGQRNLMMIPNSEFNYYTPFTNPTQRTRERIKFVVARANPNPAQVPTFTPVGYFGQVLHQSPYIYGNCTNLLIVRKNKNGLIIPTIQ